LLFHRLISLNPHRFPAIAMWTHSSLQNWNPFQFFH